MRCFCLKKSRTVKEKVSFNHLVINLFSQHLVPLSVPGMGNRVLNKTDTFPTFLEHERKRRIINIEKSGNEILYFYMIEKGQEYLKGSDAEASLYWVFKKDFTEEVKFK